MHQIKSDATGNDLTWAASDYANFQVLAIKSKDFTKRVNFVLTGTADSVIGGLGLQSGFIDDVYDDTRWTFSVALKPNTKTNRVPGSTGSLNVEGYTVEFYGVEKIVDVIKNDFFATETITANAGLNFLNYPKAPYIGAHRTNFSGTLREKADGNISSARVKLQNNITSFLGNNSAPRSLIDWPICKRFIIRKLFSVIANSASSIIFRKSFLDIFVYI